MLISILQLQRLSDLDVNCEANLASDIKFTFRYYYYVLRTNTY